ncbi:LEU7 protein, partial [Dromaius novaehollandiae]|nr:leukemia-associated protein 7 [Dromaius novaehollandiae]NXG27176.1 LEU7 protein [Dromaius novaehollandiae]
MAGPAALLASISHQLGGLRTLRLLQGAGPWGDEAAAQGLPHCPGHAAQTQTPGAGGSWHSPGGVCRPGQSWGPEAERKAPGKSPRGGAASRERALPDPGAAVPEPAAQPGPAKPGTLREAALRSKLVRVVGAAAQLVEAEQTLLLPLLQERSFPVHLKDSIEFRNICSRMALQKEGQQFDRDLHEAHQCLKTIIEKLIYSLAVFPSESYIPVRSALRQILQNLLAI